MLGQRSGRCLAIRQVPPEYIIPGLAWSCCLCMHAADSSEQIYCMLHLGSSSQSNCQLPRTDIAEKVFPFCPDASRKMNITLHMVTMVSNTHTQRTHAHTQRAHARAHTHNVCVYVCVCKGPFIYTRPIFRIGSGTKPVLVQSVYTGTRTTALFRNLIRNKSSGSKPPLGGSFEPEQQVNLVQF